MFDKLQFVASQNDKLKFVGLRTAPPIGERLAATTSSHSNNLRHDRQRNLFRSHCADIQTYGSVHSVKRLLRRTTFAQTFQHDVGPAFAAYQSNVIRS